MNTVGKEPRSKNQEPNKLQFLNPNFKFRSSNIQHPASRFALAVTSIQHLVSSIKHPTSCFVLRARSDRPLNTTPFVTTSPDLPTPLSGYEKSRSSW